MMPTAAFQCYGATSTSCCLGLTIGHDPAASRCRDSHKLLMINADQHEEDEGNQVVCVRYP